MTTSASFHSKTKEFLEFYNAFCWGCQEVHKTHNFGVPRNHLPTIQKKTSKVTIFLSCAVAFPEAFFFRFLGTPETGLLELIFGMAAKQANQASKASKQSEQRKQSKRAIKATQANKASEQSKQAKQACNQSKAKRATQAKQASNQSKASKQSKQAEQAERSKQSKQSKQRKQSKQSKPSERSKQGKQASTASKASQGSRNIEEIRTTFLLFPFRVISRSGRLADLLVATNRRRK